MFKNRTSIVAAMTILGLLIQFGFDPFSLNSPSKSPLPANLPVGNYPANYPATPPTIPTSGWQNSPAAISAPVVVPLDSRSLLVGSFNIQVFGGKKVGNSDVTRILVDLVRKFDLVAIQELRSTEQNVLDRFLEMINSQGANYRYVVGERQGYTISKEQYVYVYDATKLKVIERPFLVPDSTNQMHRPPLATRFQSTEIPDQQAFSFTLLNVHTDPDNVTTELKILETLLAWVRSQMPYEDDVILLGDFNAPTSLILEFRLLPSQFAAIRDNWTTNVRENRNYDNLVFDGAATSEFTGKSGVLNFRQLYQLQLEDALTVSDHFPVWAEFSIFEDRNSVAAGNQSWPKTR
jgi:endonuclease/exonuclease/phosphatase family metal-dependent hydrolase